MLFSRKIPLHVAARLTPRFWVPHLLRFATARHYSRLFAIICAIRDYSHYSYYSLFWTIRFPYSRLFAIRFSGFPDTLYRMVYKTSDTGLLLPFAASRRKEQGLPGNRRRRMPCKRYRATGIIWRNSRWSWAEASHYFWCVRPLWILWIILF